MPENVDPPQEEGGPACEGNMNLPEDSGLEVLYDSRRSNLLREGRSAHFWRAALVGMLAGLAAVLFQYALQAAEVVRNRIAQPLHLYLGLWGVPVLMAFCAALGGLSVYLTRRFAPEASGSGIPQTKEAVLGIRAIRWARVIAVKFVGGCLAIGAGMSLGREGPTVHIGASVGKAVSQKLHIPRRSYKTLIASGAGAGLAAAFNAPLAGFLFVIEELQRELTPVTYGAALIASVTADAVTRLIIGQQPAFRITGYPAPPLSTFPLIILLGVVAGLLGVAFNKCLLLSLKASERFNWTKGLVAGAVAGLFVWFLPAVTGGGHATAEIVLSGHFTQISALGMLWIMLLGKFALTMISYASGAPGGLFAPMLVIGAFMGLGFGDAASHLFPHLMVTPAAFAVLGMAALFASVVRAPLTGIVLIFEMTSNYDQLYALIVVCLVSYLVAELLHDRPIYEALFEYDIHKGVRRTHPHTEPVLVEFFVEPGSCFDGIQVEELKLPPECALVSVLRGQNEFIPPAKLHIKTGDVVVFLTERNDPRLIHMLAKMARA